MKLWIRSQDRKILTQIENIYLSYDSDRNISYIENTLVGRLGAYSGKEKALEILDEIQNILVSENIYVCKKKGEVVYENTTYDVKEYVDMPKEEVSTVVFEMPKEMVEINY